MRKKGEYIIVYDWMTKELDLHGIERDVYALLYGFTEKGKAFKGSEDYIAERLGVSRKSVSRALKTLIESGCLEKDKKPDAKKGQNVLRTKCPKIRTKCPTIKNNKHITTTTTYDTGAREDQSKEKSWSASTIEERLKEILAKEEARKKTGVPSAGECLRYFEETAAGYASLTELVAEAEKFMAYNAVHNWGSLEGGTVSWQKLADLWIARMDDFKK